MSQEVFFRGLFSGVMSLVFAWAVFSRQDEEKTGITEFEITSIDFSQINIRPHSGRFFIFGHSPKHYWRRTSALFIGLPATQLLLATRKRVSSKFYRTP